MKRHRLAFICITLLLAVISLGSFNVSSYALSVDHEKTISVGEYVQIITRSVNGTAHFFYTIPTVNIKEGYTGRWNIHKTWSL